MSLCSPYVESNIGRVTVYANEAALPVASPDLYEGKMAWVADVNTLVVYDGSGWLILDEPITSYTPTLSNATLGNGTLACTKRRSGGYCDVVLSFTLGSTSAVSGSVGFTLPYTAVSTVSIGAVQALLNDAGTGTWIGQAFGSSTTVITVAAVLASGTYAQQWGMSNVIPFTWATNDSIQAAFRYRLNDPYL